VGKMIESITLKNVATFDVSGVQINDLKKINFIYGANGSGKTTISKFIDKQTDSIYTNCSLVWKNGLPIKALVYNRDFREKNFGKGSIDGVFTLGQANKEDIEAIKKMEEELAEIKNDGIKKEECI
jgi:wobble nucleotide-excising tRNase